MPASKRKQSQSSNTPSVSTDNPDPLPTNQNVVLDADEELKKIRMKCIENDLHYSTILIEEAQFKDGTFKTPLDPKYLQMDKTDVVFLVPGIIKACELTAFGDIFRNRTEPKNVRHRLELQVGKEEEAMFHDYFHEIVRGVDVNLRLNISQLLFEKKASRPVPTGIIANIIPELNKEEAKYWTLTKKEYQYVIPDVIGMDKAMLNQDQINKLKPGDIVLVWFKLGQ